MKNTHLQAGGDDDTRWIRGIFLRGKRTLWEVCACGGKQPNKKKVGDMDQIHVVHRDGTRVPFDANKINLALVKAADGLPDPVSKVVQVATELQLTLFDGITTEQLDEAVIHTALQNVKDDPDYDTIATRLFLKNIYKNITYFYHSNNPMDNWKFFYFKRK